MTDMSIVDSALDLSTKLDQIDDKPAFPDNVVASPVLMPPPNLVPKIQGSKMISLPKKSPYCPPQMQVVMEYHCQRRGA